MRRNVGIGSGLFALAAVGLFALYRNRNTVRDLLGRQGIRVPHRDEVIDRLRDSAERIRTNANRIINRVQREAEALENQPRETLKEVG